MRKTYKYLIYIVLFALISLFFTYKKYSESPNTLSHPTTIFIEHGANSKNIVQMLANNNIIKMPMIFYCMVSYQYRINNKIKAGEYTFYPNETPKEVLEKIIKYHTIRRKITIPEHLTVTQILDLIEANTALKGDIRNVELQEGDLFPSTYFFHYGDDKNKILNMMKLKQDHILNKYMQFLDKNSPLKNKDDVLILASIVEQEANNNLDKPKIASVFINRLKRNMRLQSCVTVIYGLTLGKEKLNRSLTYNDYKIDSPYNTYKIYGLPKGPISCPGESAIKAVILPEKTNFLYFVANKQGKTFFAKTFQEHIKNKKL